MNNVSSQKRIAITIAVLFFVVMIVIAYTYSGTGDEGDSIMHFLFSKYAFEHTHHFFHHWAKPVYVLITCIPAQFGFIGIQVFNIFINALSIYLSFCVAQKLGIKHAWLVPLFLAVFPHQIIYSLSGLTEPLFAFALILLIHLWLYDKKIIALLLLSFLPFIRSEGLLVMVVFFIYLLLKKEWKILPLLMVGHVVYSLLGFIIYDKSLLWIFNENPYAVGTTSYGSGPWDAFINNIRFSTGIILYYILWLGMLLGLIYSILKFILKKEVAFTLEFFFLIYGIFFSVFFFHSFAWYKGIFHSFGLIRVMVGVLPLISIICAKVINDIFLFIPETKYPSHTIGVLIILVVATNFGYTKYAVIPDRDLQARGDQKCQNEIGNYLWQYHRDCYNLPMYYAAPYISIVLNRDYFDQKIHPDFRNDFHNNVMKKPCYVLWDDWYAPVECDVKLEDIETNPSFKKIKKFWHWDINSGKDRVTILYKIE
ncbi:MAG TPA: hypothetical protein PKK18_08200 [Chitinophagales bacterium]|nr:hypothetical protein [Chitinophagales bacterium]HMW12658.1 hypothetical protein [Chitinophagales bacterium]HMX59126.1 hypothetical protein [Chitinophagales bacterium]HMY22776.1 hypothetical protein [Chitinophagales bacterium]HMZ33269.1 hypothetical protein [Chitinophagales bacterium]